jgi:adenylate cyclase class 2
MYEVELKVRADHARVRDRLDELGARKTGEVRQVDTYYDAPHREFAETDEALRLRRETDGAGETTVVITYKGPLVDRESKTREEHETAVADGAAAGEILASLGFDPAATVEKDRRFFSYDGYTVTLDAVDGLGEFVEVETEVATDDGEVDSGAATPDAVAAAREGAIAVLDELGLAADEQIRTSYLGLLLAE